MLPEACLLYPSNPGKVKVATVGKLTGDHLFLMQIEKLTGAKFTQVPYSGSGKAIPALLSGEVDAYFGSGSSFLRMEKTRGLAIGSKERYELCPDVPTFIEPVSYTHLQAFSTQEDSYAYRMSGACLP